MNDIERRIKDLSTKQASERLDRRIDTLLRNSEAKFERGFPRVVSWWQCLAAMLLCVIGGYVLHAAMPASKTPPESPVTQIFLMQSPDGNGQAARQTRQDVFFTDPSKIQVFQIEYQQTSFSDNSI